MRLNIRAEEFALDALPRIVACIKSTPQMSRKDALSIARSIVRRLDVFREFDEKKMSEYLRDSACELLGIE